MNTNTGTSAASPPRASGADIHDWRPEDPAFWEATGKRVAYRNLWISIPALLCGFAVWGMWGIITVQMLNLGFPFTQAELFTLTAIAGIAGATMRIPASFLIRLAGGRNVIFLTTAMLLAPAIGTGIVLQHKDWPLWSFQLMALWCGVGGGNFASSMSNISGFFPKRLQGTALGLNAGLGNFGVTTMQIVIPLIMTVGIFGAIGGAPEVLLKESGWIFGKIPAGTLTWIQNAGFAWVLSLVPLSILCWFGMNNLKTISPDTGNPLVAFSKITYLYTLAFVPSIFMLWLYLPAPTGLGVLNVWVAIPLYIKVISAFIHVPDANGVMTHPQANPNALPVLAYAWIGPLIGALTRPIGGWISDKIGGSIVTQWVSAVMVVASVAVGYVMMKAYHSATPEEYFFLFLALFIVLFAATGVGNGSTFRSIGAIFDNQQAGPVLGWTSAVAAYGAFAAPVVIGEQIKLGTPQTAMYGFAIFYALCLVLNWWFYLRKNAYVKNP